MTTPRKTIITCAVTGDAPFNPKHPAFPITPAQIAEACVEAAQAGAAVVHIHARDPVTGKGTRSPALFKEIVDRVRSTGVDVLINLTCGHGAVYYPDPADEARGLPESEMLPVAERVAHLRDCLPDISSLNATTGNQVEGGVDYVYMNTPRAMREMATTFRALGVKPEIEVFAPGDVLFVKQMIDDGLIDAPPLFQMVLGVLWGAPATVETMLYLKSLLPAGAEWAGFGIARQQMPMVAQAALLGGHVRVGLEDNLYLSRGVFATNGQLVERAATIVSHLGLSVATPGEARAILGIPARR